MTLYSTFAEEREAIDRFFVFYDMREVPRKTQYPETNILESEQPPNLCHNTKLHLDQIFTRNRKPYPRVSFKYRTTFISERRCDIQG